MPRPRPDLTGLLPKTPRPPSSSSAAPRARSPRSTALAGACFLAAALALLAVLIPASWLAPPVIVDPAASAVLYNNYFGVDAIIPLAWDALLLWGLFARHWTVAALRGG